MMSGSYRGVVKGGAIVFRETPVPLADGTEVLVTPLAPEPGTPAAVLAAMAAEPHVPSEWVDELEQLMEEGRRPPSANNPFEEGSRGLEAE
jgi:hypothetical protein